MANRAIPPKPRTGISQTVIGKDDINFSTSSSDIKKVMHSNALYDRYEMDWCNKFSRYGILDPYNTLTGTKEYIFITKPDLPILDTITGNVNKILENNTFFARNVPRYKDIANQLQSSYKMGINPFMAVLSNAVTSSLDMPGITSEMIETASNTFGTRISYRGTSMKSDEDFDFSLEFEDTKNLDIYMLFKMWDEFEKLKWDGAIDITKADTAGHWINYAINKILYDQVTVYKIVVADDGYRIVYWARIVGCVPISIPREAFSNMEEASQQKITVGWKGHFVRDMDPLILHHFNRMIDLYHYDERARIPLFDMDNHMINGEWATIPYIKFQTNNGKVDYFLTWCR